MRTRPDPGTAGSGLPDGTMAAACLTAFDGPGGLEVRSVPVPRPGPDEVVVAVHTVGANQLDLNTMRGLGPGAAATLPLVLGVDPAGVVVDQGDRVRGERRGQRVVVKPNIACGTCRFCRARHEADCPSQRVVGVHRPGGAAQFVAVPAGNAFAIGDLDFPVATAAVHSVPIALHAINAAGGVDRTATVLVTGATGAIGSAAVQLARDAGARVLAASTSRLVDLAGAEPLRYQGPQDLVEAVRAAAPDGVDLAVDGTGSGAVMGAAVRSLAWKGTLVVCGASVDRDLPVDARDLYLRRRTVRGVASADYAEVEHALRLIAGGAVRPMVGPRFPLTGIRAAYAAVADRARHGKVIVDVR
jgi:D-arabinose 1-dehydrogenase-like Zn-dependent alcohol dehydrogenase